MKRIVFILVLSLLLGACERKKDTVIRMETSLGNIRLKLYDETVLHRDNILKLIREGYYNGMLFHRVIKDFMIQTGDPCHLNSAVCRQRACSLQRKRCPGRCLQAEAR